MMNNTIILETYRKEIPIEPSVDFVVNLIVKDRPIIEYFGIELDNEADYVSREMLQKISLTTIITINFESRDEINYNTYTPDEVYDLICKYFSFTMESKIKIDSDGKDITINF
ncbi:hypothetical protein [Flavobacterium lipolyticum]|uniref:Uncharacterized protein n=1 Tax=Flavobacterium lipolyticum TaxID=2893754 RepID=A0ABS8LYC5_9FLAO|nr:hypothetical protein [Flavobacterium sp. F-126]MCC9016943.1 hypothetical protein [Flavobacterium sp. F-126]